MAKITLRGAVFEADTKDVSASIGNLHDGWGRRYAVRVNGRHYPPKDVLLKLLERKFHNNKDGIGFTRMDFTTMDAARILRRLGFQVMDKSSVKPAGLSECAGILSLGGDSVKDSEVYEYE